MTKARIELPQKLAWLFSGKARYRGAHGGRGSGKSFNFAKMAAIRGVVEPLRVLCCREIQNSIKDSSMAEVIRAIDSEPWLTDHYEYGKGYIEGRNGTDFLFKGLARNAKAIKSTARVKIAWVEEAEDVSEPSWRSLIPTIREPDSEIWVTWNPEREDSATNQRFIAHQPSNAKIVQLNYMDNKWFPPELEQERLDDLRRDPDMYRHIWLGETITRTDAQVFNKRWRVEAFDDRLSQLAKRFYFGADFGFARDPATLIRFFIIDNRLFIDQEAWGVGVELDEMPDFYDRVPESRKWPIKADCARPETISYLRRKGFRIAGAKKWQGSVEDGITHLKGYDEIVIHERCVRTAAEFSKYSYKVDKNTDEVLPIIIDKWNHCVDAIRYGLDGVIQARGGMALWEQLGR